MVEPCHTSPPSLFYARLVPHLILMVYSLYIVPCEVDGESGVWCHSGYLLDYLIGLEFVAISGLLQVVKN
jgi:hypothetical protein